jgi:peptide/nickel transport system permease protein
METLFALPGLGTSTLTAITRRDYSQLQTNALFIGAVVVTMNLLIDLTYSVLDPRVRLN